MISSLHLATFSELMLDSKTDGGMRNQHLKLFIMSDFHYTLRKPGSRGPLSSGKDLKSEWIKGHAEWKFLVPEIMHLLSIPANLLYNRPGGE